MAKKEVVRTMFDDIAPGYDGLNHLLSFNIDKRWRKLAIGTISSPGEKILLDVACGTGDFSIAAAQKGFREVVGIDISGNMIAVGRCKVEKKGLKDRLVLQEGDSENMVFEDHTFDVVTVSFGVRNFENLEKGLREMYRVLKPGGEVVILEFSMPARFPMKQLYKLYFLHVLPLVGGMVSGNKGAYHYLPQSVLKFPQGNSFLRILSSCGFKEVSSQPLTFGIASLYRGKK